MVEKNWNKSRREDVTITDIVYNLAEGYKAYRNDKIKPVELKPNELDYTN